MPSPTFLMLSPTSRAYVRHARSIRAAYVKHTGSFGEALQRYTWMVDAPDIRKGHTYRAYAHGHTYRAYVQGIRRKGFKRTRPKKFFYIHEGIRTRHISYAEGIRRAALNGGRHFVRAYVKGHT